MSNAGQLQQARPTRFTLLAVTRLCPSYCHNCTKTPISRKRKSYLGTSARNVALGQILLHCLVILCYVFVLSRKREGKITLFYFGCVGPFAAASFGRIFVTQAVNLGAHSLFPPAPLPAPRPVFFPFLASLSSFLSNPWIQLGGRSGH